ncbi:hypothetical protein PF010_g8065 [Phytophthora fragariae]|uniref:Uncharacterized protein n=1 Tax=Phytophthora fragariae TaxID=53985 RepID=A0A6A3L6S3_9STRA|nr:hypothetical protein PF011_g7658 [Phytophthora fragariae]KAE9118872.1 hypothetical protein PF010_g8065 [Phytophthora fragariae]KAE9239874.1 hypothetical protein PF004_g7752 [Phytophthora fragariae]KAE9359473.1 hypothetical protein PF008_g2242 [Phytophthora fragariae]
MLSTGIFILNLLGVGCLDCDPAQSALHFRDKSRPFSRANSNPYRVQALAAIRAAETALYQPQLVLSSILSLRRTLRGRPDFFAFSLSLIRTGEADSMSAEAVC